MHAARGEPVAFIDLIHLSTVLLPRSYSSMISRLGLPALWRSTICLLNSSVKCLGCLGSLIYGPPVSCAPPGTVHISVANPIESIRFAERADEEVLAYYVDAVRRAAEEKARLEGLVEAEARKPRWRKRVDSLRCLKGVDTASAADLVFEAGEFSRFGNARSFAAWVGLTPSEHSSGESDRRGAITKAGNKHLRKTLVEAAWHYLTCSGRPKDLAKGQAPDRGARRHAAKGVRRLAERREALLARGVHGNKANVATARELACWVWAVGLMAEEA